MMFQLNVSRDEKATGILKTSAFSPSQISYVHLFSIQLSYCSFVKVFESITKILKFHLPQFSHLSSKVLIYQFQHTVSDRTAISTIYSIFPFFLSIPGLLIWVERPVYSVQFEELFFFLLLKDIFYLFSQHFFAASTRGQLVPNHSIIVRFLVNTCNSSNMLPLLLLVRSNFESSKRPELFLLVWLTISSQYCMPVKSVFA